MSGRKRLSCRRCQARKIRCSRQQPCASCAQIEAPCEYRQVDVRRRPVSQTHLASVESRLAWYESFVRRLQNSSSEDRDKLLHDVILDDNLTASTPQGVRSDDPVDSPESLPGQPMALLPGPAGSLQFHGPTSMYLYEDSEVTSPSTQQIFSEQSRAWVSLQLDSTWGIDDSFIKECLRLFFIHEYPRCMFIYREVFLEDYFTQQHDGKYWSPHLVYAMCALGGARSADPDISSKTILLAKFVQEAIFHDCLASSSVTTLQTLLCISLHELGQGSSSLAWLFSGMAFRMGQELGFHQDPRRWASHDLTIKDQRDVEIRRRVYWGCYVADKQISLFLGRPYQLAEHDAAVNPSEKLPDFPANHSWFGLGNLASTESIDGVNGPPLLTMSLKYTVTLSEILQDSIKGVLSLKSALKRETAIFSALGELNLRLSRWHSELPEDFQWSQWVKKGKILRSSVLELHLYYHSIVLSLNRNFLSRSYGHSVFGPSEAACVASSEQVVALVRYFRNQHGNSNPSLVMIYAIVLTTLFLSSRSSSNSSLKKSATGDSRVTFCLRLLKSNAGAFNLAREAYSRLASRLQLHTNNDKDCTPARQLCTDGSVDNLTDLSCFPTNYTLGALSEDARDPFFGPSHDMDASNTDLLGETVDAGVNTITMDDLQAMSLPIQDNAFDWLQGNFSGCFPSAFDESMF